MSDLCPRCKDFRPRGAAQSCVSDCGIRFVPCTTCGGAGTLQAAYELLLAERAFALDWLAEFTETDRELTEGAGLRAMVTVAQVCVRQLEELAA